MEHLQFPKLVRSSLDEVVAENGLIYCGWDVQEDGEVNETPLRWSSIGYQLKGSLRWEAVLTTPQRGRPLFVYCAMHRSVMLPESLDGRIVDAGCRGELFIKDAIPDTNDPHYQRPGEPIRFFEPGGEYLRLTTDFQSIQGQEKGILKERRIPHPDTPGVTNHCTVSYDREHLWEDLPTTPEIIIPEVLKVIPRILRGDFGYPVVFR